MNPTASSSTSPTAAGDAGDGQGLEGMRERVRLHGGELGAHPVAGEGLSCWRGSRWRHQRSRVLLVDDHALARTGFRMVLDTECDIEVVGASAASGQTARAARPWGMSASVAGDDDDPV